MKLSKIAVLMVLIPTLVLASPSGTLVLSGIVAVFNSITITPNGTNNSTLNIASGAADVNVASVSETSNDGLGYKITVQSANGGFLENTTDATKKTAYTLSYDGAAMSSPTTSAVMVKNVSSLTQQTTDVSIVTVTVTALPTALAGTYSDTVTFAIVAN